MPRQRRAAHRDEFLRSVRLEPLRLKSQQGPEHDRGSRFCRDKGIRQSGPCLISEKVQSTVACARSLNGFSTPLGATVPDSKISNSPWFNMQSEGGINFLSAPTHARRKFGVWLNTQSTNQPHLTPITLRITQIEALKFSRSPGHFHK